MEKFCEKLGKYFFFQIWERFEKGEEKMVSLLVFLLDMKPPTIFETEAVQKIEEYFAVRKILGEGKYKVEKSENENEKR